MTLIKMYEDTRNPLDARFLRVALQDKRVTEYATDGDATRVMDFSSVPEALAWLRERHAALESVGYEAIPHGGASL